MVFHEDSNRSLVKTISYRILIIIATSLILFIFTGNVELTLGVTLVTSIVCTILYYIHERVWNNIHWGKKERS